MTLKTKAWMLVMLVGLLWILTFSFSQSPGILTFYGHHIYPAIQSGRLVLLSIIPFSVGDLIYTICGCWLLLTIVRWVYYIRKLGACKEKLAGSLLNTVNACLIGYLLFVICWGANYYQEPLAKAWKLPATKIASKEQRKAHNIAAVTAFNKFLSDKLNQTAPSYRPLSDKDINEVARVYYREFTNSKVKENGFDIKSSLFGFFLQRMGIDGYYNPFTGEGQMSTRIPQFMKPFTLCHEMAHQAGIAAEGDANLMAYAISTLVSDPSFQYSAYLNLWLYANNRLFYADSALATSFQNQLNPLTRAHIDTLDEINRKYHGIATRYTSSIYDSYLRMQNQEEGIKSYGNVTREAWLLELKRKQSGSKMLKIP